MVQGKWFHKDGYTGPAERILKLGWVEEGAIMRACKSEQRSGVWKHAPLANSEMAIIASKTANSNIDL